MSDTHDLAPDIQQDIPQVAPQAVPSFEQTLEGALAALPGDHTVIVALRDGFKDEHGAYHAKWHPAVVSLSYARRMAQADRTIKPIDELRSMIARGASKIELRNCCRHAGVAFDGGAQRDDFAAILVAYLDREVSAAVSAYLSPSKPAARHEGGDVERSPRSSRKSGSRAKTPTQIEGEDKPPAQIEHV